MTLFLCESVVRVGRGGLGRVGLDMCNWTRFELFSFAPKPSLCSLVRARARVYFSRVLKKAAVATEGEKAATPVKVVASCETTEYLKGSVFCT